ncbi:MAG TPA: orotate phosphoribosyltransferase [Pseudogracilibacillus sp.]|nr:orotate phosphoribosyltransferase [Pseudogracilibacillus sp.]
MTNQTDIAEELLRIKAIQLRTNVDEFFTWTSGIKSPIYCDNRLTMSYPVVRKKIKQAFMKMIESLDQKPEVIAGCATAGIPHAAWIAEELDLPMVYVRSSPKGHGKENQIEGIVAPGQKVLVIEDLISTGGSSIEMSQVLRDAEADVMEVFAIFTYGLHKAKTAFTEAELNYQTITDFDQLLEMLQQKQEITEAETERLLYWRNQL